MAAGLRDRQFDVNVITALPNYPKGRIFPDYRGKLWRSEVIDDIPVTRFWLYPSNSASAAKRILNMFSFSAMLFLAIPLLIRTLPHVVIVNSPPLPVGVCGVLLSKLVRATTIANISDIWPMTALDLGAIQKGWFYSLLEKLERFVYRKSDAVMAQSNQTIQHVLTLFPNKVTFLYRNLDYPSEYIDYFPADTIRLPKIVYAGLLGVAQGVYDICTNVDFSGLGAEFHIYGDGNERSRIEQFIKENPERRIVLHQTVPKSDMPYVLTQYHATIIPLRTDIRGAFPSKIYMALSASLPVIFCGSGEGAEFIRDAAIGWTTGPGDYQDLAKKIAELAAMSDSAYKALRNHIRLVATENYDVEEQLNRLLQFIEEIRQ